MPEVKNHSLLGQYAEVGPLMLPLEQVFVYVQNPHCAGRKGQGNENIRRKDRDRATRSQKQT